MNDDLARSVLGVSKNCEPRDVHRAFRTRARPVHPDKTVRDSPASRQQKETEFKQLANARDQLLKVHGYPPPRPLSPPPLPSGLAAATPRDAGKAKLILNRVAAGITVLLALWTTIADFAYPGNLLFQDSSSGPMTGFYLGALFFVMLVLAALPKRIIVVANLLILIRIAMGWPLSLLIDHNLACRIASLGLLALAVFHLATSLRALQLPQS